MTNFLLNSFNDPINIEFEGKPVKVEFISLLYKKRSFDLKKIIDKQEMISYEVVWIRISDDQGIAYNVVAKNVLIICNAKGLLIQINSIYEEVTVIDIVTQLKELSLKSSNSLDFTKDSVFDDYIVFLKKDIASLQKKRLEFIKNSSTNSDISKLNKWVNKRDDIIYKLSKLEILEQLSTDNKVEIEEVINEKRLNFV